MAITIRDVARAAGVSTATVSRALRGLPNVDEQTRQRVKRVASELDYVISPSASRLASGRTGSIAVITPYISRWFFSTVLSGIESVLQDSDMDLLLLAISNSDAQHRLPPAPRLRRRVDGILAISVPPTSTELAEVVDLGLPLSLIGTRLEGTSNVTIDDVAAGRIATRHLINLGHTRIGIISGNEHEAPFTAEPDRLQGFNEAMAEAGLETDPSLQELGHYTIAGGEQAMTALLHSRQRPTAVFAMSDEMAFGALRALQRHGLQPGRDIALIGIDGHDMSEYLDLTTVAQPVFQLGRMAAESLLVQVRDGQPAPDPIRLPTRLIVRGSTSVGARQ